MRVTSDMCTSVTSDVDYVARAREIHSCEAPPAGTLVVEMSRLTLDAGAPNSRKEGKEMVDHRIYYSHDFILGSDAE